MKYFVWVICGVISAVIIAGLFIAGSPVKERDRRFDGQRIQDLSNIQYQIVEYWQRKNTLPETIDSLRSDLRDYIPPRDPANGKSYEYTPKPPFQFVLCATFAQSGDRNDRYAMPFEMPHPSSKGSPIESSWNHGEGRTCFVRTIDPDYYKPIKEPKEPPYPSEKYRIR